MTTASFVRKSCDRCGASVNVDHVHSQPQNWLRLVFADVHQATNSRDLCPDCATSFKIWLDQPRAQPAHIESQNRLHLVGAAAAVPVRRTDG
jgi:hypothetical protein